MTVSGGCHALACPYIQRRRLAQYRAQRARTAVPAVDPTQGDGFSGNVGVDAAAADLARRMADPAGRLMRPTLAGTDADEPAADKTAPKPPEEANGADTAHDLSLALGQNLRRLRTRQGLSLERFAQKSGVSRAMLGQIENGRSVPTIGVVWKVAKALDVPFSSLLTAARRPAPRCCGRATPRCWPRMTAASSPARCSPMRASARSSSTSCCWRPTGRRTPRRMRRAPPRTWWWRRARSRSRSAPSATGWAPATPSCSRPTCRHSYRNPGADKAVMYLVMTYIEIGGIVGSQNR